MNPAYEQKCSAAELPAVTRSGTTAESATIVLSTTRCTWQKREKHARGKFGLKIVPLGATTVTQRKIPSFCGTGSSSRSWSSSSVRIAKYAPTSSDPSKGTL